MSSIRSVISEPIEGQEEYHIMVCWCMLVCCVIGFANFIMSERKAIGKPLKIFISYAIVHLFFFSIKCAT